MTYRTRTSLLKSLIITGAIMTVGVSALIITTSCGGGDNPPPDNREITLSIRLNEYCAPEGEFGCEWQISAHYKGAPDEAITNVVWNTLEINTYLHYVDQEGYGSIFIYNDYAVQNGTPIVQKIKASIKDHPEVKCETTITAKPEEWITGTVPNKCFDYSCKTLADGVSINGIKYNSSSYWPSCSNYIFENAQIIVPEKMEVTDEAGSTGWSDVVKFTNSDWEGFYNFKLNGGPFITYPGINAIDFISNNNQKLKTIYLVNVQERHGNGLVFPDLPAGWAPLIPVSVEDCQSDFGTSTTRGECSESADTNANPLASKWLFSCQGYKSEFEANNAGAKNYVFTNTSGNHNGGAAYWKLYVKNGIDHVGPCAFAAWWSPGQYRTNGRTTENYWGQDTTRSDTVANGVNFPSTLKSLGGYLFGDDWLSFGDDFRLFWSPNDDMDLRSTNIERIDRNALVGLGRYGGATADSVNLFLPTTLKKMSSPEGNAPQTNYERQIVIAGAMTFKIHVPLVTPPTYMDNASDSLVFAKVAYLPSNANRTAWNNWKKPDGYTPPIWDSSNVSYTDPAV